MQDDPGRVGARKHTPALGWAQAWAPAWAPATGRRGASRRRDDRDAPRRIRRHLHASPWAAPRPRPRLPAPFVLHSACLCTALPPTAGHHYPSPPLRFRNPTLSRDSILAFPGSRSPSVHPNRSRFSFNSTHAVARCVLRLWLGLDVFRDHVTSRKFMAIDEVLVRLGWLFGGLGGGS